MSAFTDLSITCSLLLTEEEIKRAYDLSSKGAVELQARNNLLNPASLLHEWMTAHEIPVAKHAPLPEKILPLFSQMAEVLPKINELAQRKSSARSLLAETLLTKQLMEGKPLLDTLAAEINTLEEETVNSFSLLESEKGEGAANLSLQTLKFILKWKNELNVAYGKLF